MNLQEEGRLSDMLLYEKGAKAMGYKLVCGVDEAGRGPLAGNVFAAACILPEDYFPEGLNDSKKISPKKRDYFYDDIIKNAISYGIGMSTVNEIDNINIRNATYLAMRRAIENLLVTPDYALIDGENINGLDTPHMCVIKGDSKCLCVAAASILAKVSRDRYMIELSDKYPDYNFSKHKGYGTKEHCEKILQFGPCEIHRRTFLRKLLGQQNV